MKKIIFVLALAMVLAGGAVGITPASSQAQFYQYPPPPMNIYATPWVGANTPWVFYNGDWFLNGILYYFFGPQYGWAPYYSYAPTYIVRPPNWYGQRWNVWYRGHPVYWNNFTRTYPYWARHRAGHHYDRRFYERHHRGQGRGWHKGYHGGPPPPRPHHVTPGPKPKPGPHHVTPRPGPKPGPIRTQGP